MISALVHLGINLAIPVMAAGLIVALGGPRLITLAGVLLPTREDQ